MQPSDRAKPAGRRPGVLPRLVVAFAVPTTILFAGFAVVAHEVAKRELETELGRRLMTVASAAAGQIRDATYLASLRPGAEDDIAYLRARRELAAMATSTRVERLYLFDQNYRSVADSGDEVPLGAVHFQAELDRAELGRMFQDGAPKASVLFEGRDGKLYKAAYAPVRDLESGEIVLAVGVEAPAAFFSRLEPLRRNLLLVGAALIVVVLIASAWVARRITRPIGALVDAAERIGRGELGEPVGVASRDELGFLAATMDRMRADLRARDERNQMMLAGIAHEVRNPLGGIELFAGILRDEIDSSDERRGHVDRIARELDYLKRVVESFLDYARRPAPELGAVDLADITRDVLAVTEAEAQAAGVTVHSELEAAPARGDRAQLKRAILNLMQNAIHAGSAEPDRPIEVSTAAGKDRAVLSIHNGGEPISEGEIERVFEPFYTRREKGTGLGLAFVREIVDDHGGDIVVESGAGKGTRFEIHLPRQS